MKKIVLGQTTEGRALHMDVERLVESRALLQANSGGGKSWALRRLLEQSHGQCQQIVLDVEGEFHTLRERYDYVLVARTGGDTLADPRSAGLLARRLLELGVSAIVDLYELHAYERIRFVRLFLEAMVDAPKDLWHPALVVLDEAHIFCPEAGKAESAGAVIDLMTRGRKRGFGGVLATQRLSKLHKDAAAEANVKLIGRASLDVDMKRAGAELGFTHREDLERLRRLERGHFFAFGPGLSDEVVEVHVGAVETTHPKAGQRATPIPPAREKVQKVLAQLADLPKEAEVEAKTLGEARAEVTRLKRELALAKKAQPPAPPAKPGRTITREVPALTGSERKLLNSLVNETRALAAKASTLDEKVSALHTRAGDISRGVALFEEGVLSRLQAAASPTPQVSVRVGDRAVVARVDAAPPAPGVPFRGRWPRSAVARPVAVRAAAAAATGDAPALGKAERAVLGVLAAHGPCDRRRLTLLAGYRWTGTFSNALSALRTAGLLVGPNTGVMDVTEEGRVAIAGQEPQVPTGRALVDYWLQHPSLGLAERKALQALLDAGREGLDRDGLCEATGYQWTGTFSNALSSLRTASLLVGRNTETMRASDELLAALGVS